MRSAAAAFALCLVLLAGAPSVTAQHSSRRTAVAIVGDAFHINGKPTYEGRTWNGQEDRRAAVQQPHGAGDLRRPEPRDARHAGPTPTPKQWDADRNTREFVAAMPEWRKHGLLAFTLNLQGGSPQGYSKDQPWHNSAFTADGALRPEYMARLETILDKADELGMVVILGIFYFGQDERLKDEAAVEARRRQRHRLAARQGLPQRADRGQQRVQRPLRPRDPASRTASTS